MTAGCMKADAAPDIAASPSLEGLFRVVRPDFRGQGRSDLDAVPLIHLDTLVADLIELIDYLALRDISLLAQSTPWVPRRCASKSASPPSLATTADGVGSDRGMGRNNGSAT